LCRWLKDELSIPVDRDSIRASFEEEEKKKKIQTTDRCIPLRFSQEKE
jgi:hypothetical protein